MIYLILTLLGLCFGDFITAFVWRLHEHKDWISERSVCEHCSHQLNFLDMVPVFGWLLLRGRCRYCHKSIPWEYPPIEALTAILFVLSYHFWPYGFDAAGWLCFGVWLVMIVGFVSLSLYDLKWLLLPNKVVYPLTVIAAVSVVVAALLSSDGTNLIRDATLGVITLGGLFYLLFQLSGGKWIGGGDVKLGFLIGMLVGGPLKSLLVLFVASVLGTVVALPLLLSHRLKVKAKIPFGPYLMLATIIVQLFGGAMIAWYKLHVFGM